MNESLLVSPDVDYTQALPIQQKRIIAFVNHFIMNTVSFLNTFAESCETKLMQFQFKLQKVDASLRILEAQLSSISDENFIISNLPSEVKQDQTDNSPIPENIQEIEEIKNTESTEEVPDVPEPKLCEDPIYSKYFKMVQVGVPIPAVKLKMKSEGLDPNILDKI